MLFHVPPARDGLGWASANISHLGISSESSYRRPGRGRVCACVCLSWDGTKKEIWSAVQRTTAGSRHVVLCNAALSSLSASAAPTEPLLCKFADGGQKKRQSQSKYPQNGRPWHREGEVSVTHERMPSTKRGTLISSNTHTHTRAHARSNVLDSCDETAR